jgi:predicted nucleotidyltransferase
VPVIEVFIKGSILTKQYSKESDIDIFVRVKGTLYTEDQLKALLQPIWEKIDDTYLDGIPHPFQYYITKEKYNIDNTEAVYDIVGDEWIKRSPSKNIDINDYMDDFQKYVEQFSDFSEELRQSMIDYEILKDLPADEVKGIQNLLSQKLKDINEAIDGLGDVYTDLKNFRNESFAKDMTPSELKQYGIKTRLPGNVVFKLIETLPLP